MAPARTRASQSGAGGGVTKKVHRKAQLPPKETTDSWQLLDRQGMSSAEEHGRDNNDDLGRQASNDHGPDQSSALKDSLDVEEAVDPLRQMADRVGREVEIFAETVDRFFSDLPTVTDRYDAAYDLVLQFKDIANNAVEELKQSYGRERREQLRKEWSEQAHTPAASSTALNVFTSSGSASLSAKEAGHVHQLRQWQQEADIWELFRVMLELHPFESTAQTVRTEKEQKLARLGPANRYTSDGDLWERFLMEDDLAKERHMVKTWLEQTANHQVSDVQSIVEELEAKAGRGKGLWSSGWMYTREKIKGEKRLRSWPNDTDSSLPQIRRSDNNEPLVANLDPDAPSRQQRTLEKQDTYFERAIWVACWEMLRRGTPLQEICEWCEDRKEGWRALVMGAAADVSEPLSGSAAWRHVCLLASQAPGCSNYEAAVFGSIGGNVKAMEAVANSIDDHLYAYYSAALTRQFDHYLSSTCPDRASSLIRSRQIATELTLDSDQAQTSIRKLIVKLRKGASTSHESAQPMKIIQSFLLADEVGSLIHTVGCAIAETESLRGSEGLIYLRNEDLLNGQPRDELEVALNKQTLRIATHMAIVHRVLSPDYLEGDELLEDENVLIAYIQTLRDAGKRLLIPLYASKLQKERYVTVIARVLQDITDAHEQAHMLRLLQESDLDVVAILNEQLSWILDTRFDRQYATTPLNMLEPIAAWKMYPGVRIRIDFLDDVVTTSDEAVEHALEWFQLLHGSWDVIFKALTIALRKSLVTGRLVCARMIVQNFPFKRISHQKSQEILGRPVNVMEDESFVAENEEEAMLLDLMRRQSQTYWEMEQLIIAIEKLSAWRSEEHKLTELLITTPNTPQMIKVANQEANDAVQPLLHGIFQDPTDEVEADDLAHIRFTYVPEVVVAYATMLHAAGNLITRESLLESMDLSVLIASGKSHAGEEEVPEDNGLLECFVKTGRMRELMNVFALTSKLMLVLKAEGRPWRQRRDRVGRDLGLWELNRTAVSAD